MKSRFEPDGDENTCPSARLIDPDEFDASEQQFAASLEQLPVPAKASFVLDADENVEEPPASSPRLTITESAVEPGSNQNQTHENCAIADATVALGTPDDSTMSPAQTDQLQSQDPDSWRNEVAVRVNNYRARRRPRAPRYPSLQLKFEAYEPARNTYSGVPESPASPSATRQAIALDSAPPAAELTSPEPLEYVAPQTAAPETARILEFPRSSFASMPPRPLDELAEPVFDRPRILEAPEIAPPPPALGGISIEPVEEAATERRPGFEVPLQSAPMAQRLAAVAIDALIVLSALSLFSYVFFRITIVVLPLQRSAAGTMVTLAGMFWVAYQYLLLVHTGTTPGLKLAKLQLSRFEGNPVPRKTRRWRVLASVLSGLSLGLGYAWCFLDEDQLCWHDRITRTYMAPIK